MPEENGQQAVSVEPQGRPPVDFSNLVGDEPKQPEQQQAPQQPVQQQPAQQSFQQPVQQQTTEQKLILERMRQKGHDLSEFESDEQFLDTLGSVISKAQQADDLQKRYQELEAASAPYWQNYDTIQQHISQKPEEKEKTEREKLFKPPVELSERELDLVSYLERDERGIYSAPSNAPYLAELAKKANEYELWEKEVFRGFRRDPEEFTWKIVESRLPDIKEQLFNEWEEKQRQQQLEAAENKFFADQASWMFESDEQGGLKVGPNGQWIPTQAGQVWHHFAQQGKQLGIPRENLLVYATQRFQEYASQFAQQEGEQPNAQAPQQVPQQGAQTPQQPNEQHKREFLGRNRLPPGSGHVPSRAGTEALAHQTDNEIPQNLSLKNATDIDEIVREVAKQHNLTI